MVLERPPDMAWARAERESAMERIRWRQIITPAAYIVLLGVIAVFAHSGLQSNHGLAALRDAAATERALEAELAALRRDRAVLQNKVTRLSERFLDLDLLDERARAVLGLVREDELAIR